MKTLVIGSTCLDLIMNVDALPSKEADIHPSNTSIAMGGMAFNVYDVIHRLGVDAILATPVGEGRFADLMLQFYKEKNITPFARVKGKDNGVCLCLVDDTGERTFISHHGAEYLFDESWYEHVDFDEVDRIYISGLEVEDKNGGQLVAFLQKKNKPILFAPGPRVLKIQKDRLEAIYDLHPMLHINKNEALMMSSKDSLEEAAKWLYQRTGESVVVTLGDQGSMICGKKIVYIEGCKAAVVDTIGAGDSNAGAILACLNRGYSLEKACEFANLVSSKVVEHSGAGYDEKWDEFLKNRFFEIND